MGVSYIILRVGQQKIISAQENVNRILFASNYTYLNKPAEKKFTERNGRNVNCHAAAV